MKKKIKLRKYIIIVLASLLFACDIYLDNKLLVTSFDQCLYALAKMDGTSSSPFSYAFMYILVCFIIICPCLLFPVIDFGKKLCIKIKNKSIQLYPIRNTYIYGIVLFVVALIYIIDVVDFIPFIKNSVLSDTQLFEEYYVDAGDTTITFPDDKKNLIYIFMESTESSNVSIDSGGLFEESIIPNLENLALDNTNFSSTEKIGGANASYGTGWTVAAMISQTAGIPLKFSIDDINDDSTVFSNVTTTGDILYENGYNNYLLLGSDADFGGRKTYFTSHNYVVYDYYSAINDGRIDSDYYEWWGYEDSKLFSYAKEMLEEISKSNEPFNFTMLTADTHFTDGYQDKSCSSVFGDDYANSFYCSDSMIGEFINWIKEQDFYEDTVIVIVGDHFTMQDDFYEEDDEDKRSIYNVFINASVNNDFENKNRVFTSMDMFPTTIGALGGEIAGDRLGLGTNLYSNTKTIPEEIGLDTFNNELMKYSNYYYTYIRD